MAPGGEMADTVLPRRATVRRRPSGTWSRVGFVAMLVVLAVALAIGSGVGASAPPTLAQRAAAIEAVIKCPSCDDLNVAQSEASSAVAVRTEITTKLKHGESAGAIEQDLVDQYGSDILLSPPDSGWSLLVWLLPALGGAGALTFVGVLFWRRSAAIRRLRTEGR